MVFHGVVSMMSAVLEAIQMPSFFNLRPLAAENTSLAIKWKCLGSVMRGATFNSWERAYSRKSIVSWNDSYHRADGCHAHCAGCLCPRNELGVVYSSLSTFVLPKRLRFCIRPRKRMRSFSTRYEEKSMESSTDEAMTRIDNGKLRD